ncbi:branched-chain amino acid ABC transporter permease [Marinitoga arctica]
MIEIFEQGLILSILSLGVFTTFKIIDTPDLTTDGSYVLGGAITVLALHNNINWIIALLIGAFFAGLSGSLTGLIHTKTKINPLLASILVMIMLYSINIRLMNGPNLSLPKNSSESTINLSGTKLDFLLDNKSDVILGKNTSFSFLNPFDNHTLLKLFIITILVFFIYYLFLKTELGTLLRAFGSNKHGVLTIGVNPDIISILGLSIGNFLVGISGGLFSIYAGFADVNMGQGMLVTGLAAVILGEIIFKNDFLLKIPAPLFGGILYQLIISMVIKYGYNIGFKASDLKLATALFIITVIALRNSEVKKWLNSKISLSFTTKEQPMKKLV